MEGRVEQHERRAKVRQRRRRALVGIGVFAVVAAVAAVLLLRNNDHPKKVVAGAAPTPSVTAATTPTTAAPNQDALIAQATVPNVAVYDDPTSASPSNTFDNPWFVNNDPHAAVPLVFLVVGQQPDWVNVMLPIRPNGAKGWVHASDVKLVPTSYHIDVSLGGHQITVYNHDQVVLQGNVAVGADATPTPTGLFYIRALLKAPNPHTVYGPYAYGLSGFSDVLQTFSGGDAEVGIHGNNDESVLGQNVTHGCVRMSNDGITQLASILPLGVPVTISA